MLRVLTEFSEENSSPERNEMLVVSLRRSSIREPQPPEFGGGEFGPGMEGWERSDQDFAEQKTER